MEPSLEIHGTGESVGQAAGALRTCRVSAPFPVGRTVGHDLMEELISDLAKAPAEVGVEGLEVELVLPHPVAEADVGRGVTRPVTFAELAREVALGKLQRPAALPLHDGPLLEVGAVPVVHLHPHLPHVALAGGQVGQPRDVHPCEPRFLDFDGRRFAVVRHARRSVMRGGAAPPCP